MFTSPHSLNRVPPSCASPYITREMDSENTVAVHGGHRQINFLGEAKVYPSPALVSSLVTSGKRRHVGEGPVCLSRGCCLVALEQRTLVCPLLGHHPAEHLLPPDHRVQVIPQ